MMLLVTIVDVVVVVVVAVFWFRIFFSVVPVFQGA